MIRLTCPHCASPFLRLTATEPDERITCPRCGKAFVPSEEEWVDPEDG
jgi:uncharacterized Zn finger protein (UPF0148 family)